MVQAVSSAISALQTLGRKMGVTANNVANATTSGFKKSRASSVDVVKGNMGGGTRLGEISEDRSQGPAISTGSATDLAISGGGYFIVAGENGDTYYTRDGQFDFDEQGRLADSYGNVLQGWAMDPESGELSGSMGDIISTMQITSGEGGPGTLLSVSVGDDGVVAGTYSNGASMDLFQIGMARFTNPEGLDKIGNNLYTATGESGDALTGVSGSNGLGRIIPQALEGSNVDLAEEMAHLMLLRRNYQANLKVIETENDMKGDVLDILS